MIGVALVTMMAVLGASAKASLDQTLAEDIVADYVVANAVGQAPPATIASDVEALPGVAEVARVRGAVLEIDGDRDFAFGVEPAAFASVARPDVDGVAEDLDADSVAISTELASSEGLPVGSTVTVGFAGEDRPLRVVATYTEDSVLADTTLSLEGFDALGVPPTDRTVYVVAEPGADRAALRRRPRRTGGGPADREHQRPGRVRREQREPIDQLLFIVYALLGLAVVIAVLGIVNTLALSVIERVREIGLLEGSRPEPPTASHHAPAGVGRHRGAGSRPRHRARTGLRPRPAALPRG